MPCKQPKRAFSLSLSHVTTVMLPLCMGFFYRLQVIQPRVIIDNVITLMRGHGDSDFPKRSITIGELLTTNTIPVRFAFPQFWGGTSGGDMTYSWGEGGRATSMRERRICTSHWFKVGVRFFYPFGFPTTPMAAQTDSGQLLRQSIQILFTKN